VAINLEILDASQSQLTQNEQVKNMIDKGCDVVCVNLVDRTEPTTITDLAENKFL
jgi:methyl-galactoside transport system substrate-binding protein